MTSSRYSGGQSVTPEIVKLSVLAFTADILVTVAVEEMITEAHKEKDARLASMFLVGGFVLRSSPLCWSNSPLEPGCRLL